jgi:hypothetical protein
MRVLERLMRLVGAFSLGAAAVFLTWLIVGVLGADEVVGYLVGILLPAVAVSGLAWRRWRASWVTAAVVAGAGFAAIYLAMFTYALEHWTLVS